MNVKFKILSLIIIIIIVIILMIIKPTSYSAITSHKTHLGRFTKIGDLQSTLKN